MNLSHYNNWFFSIWICFILNSSMDILSIYPRWKCPCKQNTRSNVLPAVMSPVYFSSSLALGDIPRVPSFRSWGQDVDRLPSPGGASSSSRRPRGTGLVLNLRSTFHRCSSLIPFSRRSFRSPAEIHRTHQQQQQQQTTTTDVVWCPRENILDTPSTMCMTKNILCIKNHFLLP